MILGIEGSPRKTGNSHKMLQAVLVGATEGGQGRKAVIDAIAKYDDLVSRTKDAGRALTSAL